MLYGATWTSGKRPLFNPASTLKKPHWSWRSQLKILSVLLTGYLVLSLNGCALPPRDGTFYGFDRYPDVFWLSEVHERWEDADEQAWLTSQAFAETLGDHAPLDFFVYVLDKPEDSPNYGEYQGYRSPGRIHIYLKVYRSTFAQTALCHELLHQYEHEVLGISYVEAHPNFTNKDKNIHFTTFSMDEANLIIRECENRALSAILEAPPPTEKELPWTHSQS